mmetsp:Transcript_20043/g.33776  ORF Transcript_20043/g.33776 Transcript_20043/m.33776 type:complete len:168 (-) Transcript_20043:261-764(-)
MGNCCDCFKSKSEEAASTEVERAPLLPRGESPPSTEIAKPMNKAEHYKAVVDSAQRNFINSSSMRFSSTNGDTEGLSSRLAGVDMTAEAAHTLVNSPPSKYSHAWEHSQPNTSQQVIDTLSHPVSVYKYDNVADEMAEMIAKHTFSMDVDDSANSTVASFKPINTAN